MICPTRCKPHSESKPKPLAFAGNAAGYLTCTEAAAYLPHHPKTIQQMCSRGQITAYRANPSGPYLLHRDVIAAWLRGHTTQPTNPLKRKAA